MREKILIVAVLFAVSTVSALMLAAVNAASRDVIIKNRERNFRAAILSVLEIEEAGKKAETLYKDRIRERILPPGKVYFSTEGADKTSIEGAAFKLTGAGFWGPISVMVGVSLPDFKIKGFEILEQGETPGLGARIEEPDFRKQFISKSLDEEIIIRVKGEKTGLNDVSAITGATISSKSLEKIINQMSRPYIEALKELSRVSQQLSSAAARSHTLPGFHPVRQLDRVKTMPALPLVVKTGHDAPFVSLATNPGEKCGLNHG